MGRKRDGVANAANSRKRRKVDSSSKLANRTDAVFQADQLDWKPVALPDRLDDAEGFYGLEEIDDVDILQSAGAKDVKFKAPQNKVRRREAVASADAASENWEADGDWEGLSDDHTSQQKQVPDTKAPQSEPKVKDKKKQRPAKDGHKSADEEKGKKQAKQRDAPPNANGVHSGLSFSALEDETMEDVDISAWDSLNLHSDIQISLSKLKFTTPTPIQSACIPPVLGGHDVIGKASTGSGKTLAFGIPILQHYLDIYSDMAGSQPSAEHKEPIALILSPTRELARQISNHLTDLINSAPSTNARIASLTGGLSIQKQQRLVAGADIIIATPGRLWEMIGSSPGFLTRLQKIRFLVVDEADRLLSEGHFKEVEEILKSLDRKEVDDSTAPDEGAPNPGSDSDGDNDRQTLVFSATFHKGLQQKLAGKSKSIGGDLLDQNESMEYLLKKLHFREQKPKFIDVNPVSQMAENLKEGLVECPAMDKDLYLYTLLLYHPKHRTLVFTNAISSVRRLTSFLQNLNLPALALHSSMAQKARLRSVERFSSPSSDPSSILIATDVAARGLDIKGIDLIIHYDVPRAADTYVHRSGRTARASASGKSILICAPDEIVGVARLAAKVHAAHNAPSLNSKKGIPLQSIDLERRIISRIKPRVILAKRITESTLAKEKISAEDDWLRSAAADLGVDYDSDEFAEQMSKGRGRNRGGGREAKQKMAGNVSKAELARLRAELRELLSKKINIGVSESYLTAGRVDVDALLKGEGNAAFLGHVEKLDF